MTESNRPATPAAAAYRWVTSGRPAATYGSVSELIRPDVPEAEVAALFATLTGIRGVHRVEIATAGETGHRPVYVRGTDRARLGAANAIAFSGLREVDPNANHDHARCVARARSLGVPAEWAHRVETYLSM